MAEEVSFVSLVSLQKVRLLRVSASFTFPTRVVKGRLWVIGPYFKYNSDKTDTIVV